MVGGSRSVVRKETRVSSSETSTVKSHCGGATGLHLDVVAGSTTVKGGRWTTKGGTVYSDHLLYRVTKDTLQMS